MAPRFQKLAELDHAHTALCEDQLLARRWTRSGAQFLRETDLAMIQRLGVDEIFIRNRRFGECPRATQRAYALVIGLGLSHDGAQCLEARLPWPGGRRHGLTLPQVPCVIETFHLSLYVEVLVVPRVVSGDGDVRLQDRTSHASAPSYLVNVRYGGVR